MDSTTTIANFDSFQYLLGNKYEIIQILGQGAYGLVFLARQQGSGQVRAIKFLDQVFFNAYEAKKVCREIQIMRYLSKRPADNIYTVQLLDIQIPLSQEAQQVTDFDQLFLVEEYFG